MKPWKKYGLLFLVFSMLGYPMLYYAYKFGTPEFGGLDVYSYYKLYANWDFAHVDSPFNQRLLSSYAIYLLHASGLHYHTETAVAALKLDPAVYFSALFFNFICVVGTSVVIYRMVEKHLRASPLFAFMSAALMFFGFGTQMFLVSGLSDALSVFLMALIFHLYLEKSWWQIPVLVAAVFQREYIFLVFGLMAAFHWLMHKQERRYYLVVLAVNVLCFAGYMVCRKTIFFTPRYVHQIEVSHIWENFKISISHMSGYVRQTLLIQNILFLYIVIFIYKRWKKMQTQWIPMTVVLLLLAEIVVLSFMIGLGNNTGRYFYMTVPIIVFYLAAEVQPLIGQRLPEHDTRPV